MRTRLLLSLFAAGALAGSAAAGVHPPVPQVPAAALNPDAAPDAPPPADDPAAIADRITENTKLAGDRLRESDTGEQTRKTQEQILKDIDALLKQAQNPPPMGGGGGNSDNKDDQDQNNQNQSGNSGGGQSGKNQSGNSGGGQGKPRGGQSGGSGNKPSGGQNTGGQGKPRGGGQPTANGAGQRPQRGSWRDRRGNGDAAKEQGGQPMPGGTQPMPTGPGQGTARGGQPMKPGDQPGGADGGLGGTSPPAPPLDDAVAKQVWGHLPERLRQQMTQYYREQFVSKYGDLLRDYYSTLSEREKSPRK